MRLTPNSEGLREANSCHSPAGSPAGGRFCSKDVEVGRNGSLSIRHPRGGQIASLTFNPPSKDYLNIAVAHVDSAFQRRGAGAALYMKAAELAKAQGKKGLASGVASRTPAANALWDSLRRTGRVRRDVLRSKYLPPEGYPVDYLESFREANSCHSPAGSPKGGQFCSKGSRSTADAEAEIKAGRPWNATEDQFAAYHNTGHIGDGAYASQKAGEFDYIKREKFQTLLSTSTINGVPVEIRLEAEPLTHAKWRPEAPDRDRLWQVYNDEAKKLGTTVMMATIDLGRDSPGYKHLAKFEQAWLAAGEGWERDAKNDLVYYTPEEARKLGKPAFGYTVGAFVGDKAVGYAGDEFGATGVYVAETYQKSGLGLKLLRTYLDKSGRLARGKKIGQMTYAGEKLARALHRQLARERSS